MQVCRSSKQLIHPDSTQPLINSNVKHFCSPHRFANSHINRINPDKNTFLNSNLIVSNILNHLSPTRSPDPLQISDAYVMKRSIQSNKDVELEKKKEMDAEYKEKIERVRNKAKCRTESAQEDFRNQEKEMMKQIEQIQIMKIEINEKSRDIMSRKEDTAYLGRNIFLQGDKFLKTMKDHNPTEKTMKSEATRMLMKQCAKKKGRRSIQIQLANNEEVSEIGTTNNNTSMNASMQASIDAHARKQSKANEEHKEMLLKRQIKDRSFDCVLKEQKRLAAWNGFSANWAMGFYKNEDIITTKKKRKNKRSPRHFVNVNDNASNSMLEYNDIFTRHQSLKKYKESFANTASSYNLHSNMEVCS